MLKRLLIVTVLLTLLYPATLITAQEETKTPVITYGETASGEISNLNFDVEYFFEGEAGDVIVITMFRSETADFDPYLYLTTTENEVLASNDDFFDRNSQIVARLPETRTYQIVATRLGERTGSGQGAYQVTLEKAQPFSSGVTVEGTVEAEQMSAGHVFVPEAAGIYTVTYKQVRGDFYPALVISRIAPDSTYTEEIARLSGQTLRGGSLVLEIEMDSIYIINLQADYYNYETAGTSSVYTINVEEAE